MDVAFFDLEYTAWDGSKARGWTGAGEHREVIEIGALIADPATRRVRRTMSVYVRPRLNPMLSDYIRALTGIRQDQVDGGANFAEALDLLLGFIDGARVWAYGLEDFSVLAENCALNRLAFDRVAALRVMDVGPKFALAGVDLATTSTGQLASQFGAPSLGPTHSALADAHSLAAATFVLVERGLIDPNLAPVKQIPLVC